MQKEVRAAARAGDVGRLRRVGVHDAQKRRGLVGRKNQGVVLADAHVAPLAADERAQLLAVPPEGARFQAVLSRAALVDGQALPVRVGDQDLFRRLERDQEALVQDLALAPEVAPARQADDADDADDQADADDGHQAVQARFWVRLGSHLSCFLFLVPV